MSAISLATSAEGFARFFEENFNRGNVDDVTAVYADDAVLNLGGDKVFRGRSEIRPVLETFLAPGLPIQVTPRFHTVSVDTAVVGFDWVIAGTGPDGQDVRMEGSAIDVLRRGRDGCWRQLLDQPFGSATAPAADAR